MTTETMDQNKTLDSSHSANPDMAFETVAYDNVIVRNFAVATVLWGFVGMLVGLIIALQIPFPSLNFHEYLSFGRIRPLHTNAVIFAFVGNAIFTGVYYSTPRLCKFPMWSSTLSYLHFWGWQLIIVSAAITLPLGISTNKEYAELEWPIDIAITVIWVVFTLNLLMTIFKRREKHMYVALWFYIASVLAVALLHVVNSLEWPVHFWKSYSIYAGVQDALVQWWYGHNAVAFFLTTPFLGLMYYFMPKAARRPVYSYRLSIIHFWSLVFIYMWAGPHHLLYSSVPDWAQSLGVVFSVMLIAPSWGGMINGLLTLRGAFDRLIADPIIKFMVVAVTCYGMSTFEGPMMSLKAVNGLTHFTDYVIAHVHVGALGWNGMLTFGMLYWLLPRIYNTKLHSVSLANTHFWIATVGMVFYVLSMYSAGILQGLMWKEITPDGILRYDFMETLMEIVPMHYGRAFGGALYLLGVVLMAYNLYRTMSAGSLQRESLAKVPKAAPQEHIHHWHQYLEGNSGLFTVMTLAAVAVGGAVEIVPSVVMSMEYPEKPLVTPYTALEIEGRDIYIREGCYNCHSQMIRPFKDEKMRYGSPSRAGEHIYDHPFTWGSKRTGPDLLREGGKRSHDWHYRHMQDPRSTSPTSLMPAYQNIVEDKLDTTYTSKKLQVMQNLGVPYTDEQVLNAVQDLEVQAQELTAELNQQLKIHNLEASHDQEIIALIAYLQKLGRAELLRPDHPLKEW